MWLPDSLAEAVLLIWVLQEIVSVHSLKITSLNSHCGFGVLFPGAGSQIFQNSHRITGFHWICWQTTSSAHSPQLLRPWVTPPVRHLGVGKSSAPLSAGEAGNTTDRMPSLPQPYWGNVGMKFNSTQSISMCSEPLVHLLSSFHLYWEEKSTQVPQAQDFLWDIALLTSISCFCKSQLLWMWPEFETDAIVQKLGFPHRRNTMSKVCAVFQETVGLFGSSPEESSEKQHKKRSKTPGPFSLEKRSPRYERSF